jgi:hypothetical protein
VNSPLLDNGVTVPISGDERAADDNRAIKPTGTIVSAFNRTTSSDGISSRPRLMAPTNPRFFVLVRISTFGRPPQVSSSSPMRGSGLASLTTTAL